MSVSPPPPPAPPGIAAVAAAVAAQDGVARWGHPLGAGTGSPPRGWAAGERDPHPPPSSLLYFGWFCQGPRGPPGQDPFSFAVLMSLFLSLSVCPSLVRLSGSPPFPSHPSPLSNGSPPLSTHPSVRLSVRSVWGGPAAGPAQWLSVIRGQADGVGRRGVGGGARRPPRGEAAARRGRPEEQRLGPQRARHGEGGARPLANGAEPLGRREAQPVQVSEHTRHPGTDTPPTLPPPVCPGTRSPARAVLGQGPPRGPTGHRPPRLGEGSGGGSCGAQSPAGLEEHPWVLSSARGGFARCRREAARHPW